MRPITPHAPTWKDREFTLSRELCEFLKDRPFTCILATTSPTTGIFATLDHVGLTDCFDQVIHSLGKPAGLVALLTSYPDTDVIGVGDIWDYDLDPIARSGGSTILMKSVFRQPPTCQPSISLSDSHDLVPALHTLLER